MNKGQQLMLSDGVPRFLLMTAEERRAAWEAHPPVAMPVFAGAPKVEDAATVALRARLEAEKKVKASVRIAKMLAKKKPSVPLVYNRRKGVFEPATQEDEMAAKITFQAFDASNELLLRGCTSIPDPATPEQIEEKVRFVFERVKSATNVSVTGIGGTKAGCWIVRDGALVRSDEDYRSAPMPKASVETQTMKEVEVAKKVKAKNAAPVKKAAKEKGERKPGVISAIVDLISRESGATIPQIVAVLVKKFPDREEAGMTKTAKIQANKNATSKDKNSAGDVVYFKKR